MAGVSLSKVLKWMERTRELATDDYYWLTGLYRSPLDTEPALLQTGPWSGDRAAEGARLEIACAVYPRTEGSNPSRSVGEVAELVEGA